MSGQFRPTANAYENNITAQYVKNTVSSDWAPLGTDKVSISFLAPISDGSDSFYLSFLNAFDDGDPIYKRIIGRYTNNTTCFDTGYILGEINSISIPYDPNQGDLRIIAWAYRDDNGVIDSSNWTGGNFIITYNKIAQGTEIPESWLTNTTYIYDNPVQTVTTVVPADYDIVTADVSPYIAIPQKITDGIDYTLLIIGRLLELRYLSFLICFVLIVGLIAWLIH